MRDILKERSTERGRERSRERDVYGEREKKTVFKLEK